VRDVDHKVNDVDHIHYAIRGSDDTVSLIINLVSFC